MSFTSVLSGITKWLGFGAGVAAAAGVPFAGTLQSIAQIALNVEAAAQAFGLQTGTGAQKFAAGLPFVEQIVTAELVAGKQIGDKALFDKGVKGVWQGVVDVLNSIRA